MSRNPISGVASNPIIGMRPTDMRPVPIGMPLRDLAPQARGLLICRLNGEWLLREDWGRVTRADDVIEWYEVPQDKETFRGILQVAALIASIWFPAAAPYLLAANVAYNVLVPPSLPKAPRRPEETGEAYTTGLAGNEARLDQPIWKVCGRREITPPLAVQPYFEYKSKPGEPDPHLDNDQYFYALYAVGIGEHDVIAKLGNTPITRFDDVLVAQYLPPGTQPSTVLANVTTAPEVSSQVLESGLYVGGFAACAPMRTCAAIGIDIVATRGLGKTEALSVQWRVEYRPINDFGQVLGPWTLLAIETRTAFTSTPQRWSMKYRFGHTPVNTSDAGSLLASDWTVNAPATGSTYATVTQDAALGNSAPSYQTLYDENHDPGSEAYAYRDFKVAGAATLNASCDIRFGGDTSVCQAVLIVGATAAGAGVAVIYVNGALAIRVSNAWSAQFAYLPLASVAVSPALSPATWYSLRAAVVRNSDGSKTVTAALYSVDGLTQLATLTTSYVFSDGDFCGFANGRNDDSGSQFSTHYDNYRVQTTGAAGTMQRLEVRVVRMDVQDTDPSALHEIAWTGLRAYLAEPAPLNPHTAHYEVEMRASDQLSHSTSRDLRLLVKARARALGADLSWQAVAHTRNPAWWLLDLATSETWGIDKPDSRVDLQSFYDLAQTAEARQDRFDWVFDSTVNAWDAMQLIARTCRARVFRRNGVLSVARDELMDLPVTAYTPRNCSPGMSIKETLRGRNSPDGIVIEYQDHRTWEWTAIECPCPGVETMENPVIRRLEGVSGATHAEREGLYEAANLLYRTRIASWTTEMQGMLPAYMSPVDFLADINGYGHSGDVVGWDEGTLVMSLSEPADFSAGAMYLTLVRDDGSVTEAVQVYPGPTEFDVLLPAAPDFTLVLDSGIRERPKYLLGAKSLVKIAGINDGGKTDDGAQLYELTGVIDDERVHSADVHLLPGPGVVQDPVGDPSETPDDDGTINIVSISDDTAYGVAANSGQNASARYELNNDGSAAIWVEPAGKPPWTIGPRANQWLVFNPAETTVTSRYEVRATLLSGTIEQGTFDTWLNLGTSRFWANDVTPLGAYDEVTGQMFIEIREVSTGIVQDRATITITAISFFDPG